MMKGCIIKGQLKFQAWITVGMLSLVNSDRTVKIYVCFALKFNSGRDDGKKTLLWAFKVGSSDIFYNRISNRQQKIGTIVLQIIAAIE